MNAVVEMKKHEIVHDTGRMSVPDVVRHVSAVQEVMRAVMKPEVHYGRIPGAGEKPTLFKQGAEVLCLAFKIGDQYRIEDLSTADERRYRVICEGVHQPTGMVLGQGVGECSSAEEKYRWRKAVCKEEFESTPENMRRVKYGKKSNGFYTVEQVRTEPADVANTVLKMASKRAKIAMTLNVTAASDMFGQDLEDLDATLREHLTDDDRSAQLLVEREEWITRATEAPSEDALRRVMKEGVKHFQSARDRDGYSLFAKAVQDRGAILKASAPKAEKDPFVADMEAAEGAPHD